MNLLTLIAECHEKLENTTLAISFLRKALELDPRNRQAMRQVDRLHTKMGIPVPKHDHFETLIEEHGLKVGC